jgi:hypothetical protein
MAVSKKKSWQEKLNVDMSPHLERLEKDYAGGKKGQVMVVPTPKLVDACIRQIPKGSKVDVATIRNQIAKEFHAELTCPLTTGIFIRIVAEAAYEEYCKGKPPDLITPFWRAIDIKSPTAKKLSFGTAFLIDQQKNEGIDG